MSLTRTPFRLVAKDDNLESAGYNLNRHCYSFTGVLGVDDNYSSGSSGEFTVATHGKTLLDTTLSLGQPDKISLNMSGVLRLDLTATATNGGNMDYGNAQVLCSF